MELYEPEIEKKKPREEQPYTTCPSCNYRGRLDDFDGLGADGDNVFCTRCHHEFDPSIEWFNESD